MRPDALSGTVFGPAPSLAYLDGHGTAAGETTRTRVLPSRHAAGVAFTSSQGSKAVNTPTARLVRYVACSFGSRRFARYVSSMTPRLLALVVLSLTLFHENFSD
jgi:hypothetical protein